jgi:hypothetical protein
VQKQDWCLRNKFDDGILVSEGKVVGWLQDEVLQRTVPPKGLRKGRRRPAGRPTQLGAAVEGSQLPTGPRKAGPSPDSGEDSSEEEEEEGETAPKALKVQTVRVYLAALAELYSAQVSMGLNKHPNFRGAALNRLMTGLSHTQARKRQETFEDRGTGSINEGYSTEEFMLMQDQLLAGAAKCPQVGLFYMPTLY